MSQDKGSFVSRRNALALAVGGAVAIGFDPVNRVFVSEAHAHRSRHSHRRLPRLEGELSFDQGALQEAADDFGHIVHRAPWVVLRPGSYEDVAKMVQFASRHRLTVAMRGQGHSAYGQAQAEGGIVIDSRFLSTIHEIGADYAVADAGATWRDVIEESAGQNLTPASLTDYIDLSVGGVLSVGGIGGQAYREGLVIDQALELTVVTGRGDIVDCSPSKHSELFFAVLGGLGQYGIILKAKIRLVPAKSFARVYQLIFLSLSEFLEAQRTAKAQERFDFIEGLVSFAPGGQSTYILQGGVWYEPGSPPDDSYYMEDLVPVGMGVSDLPYLAWLSRLDGFVDNWKQLGVWDTPHPWSDLILSDEKVESFAEQALEELLPEEFGYGVILLYPFSKGKLKGPMFQTPSSSSDTVWLFDILRMPEPGADVDAMVAKNRELLDRATAVGGKRYPISAVPVTRRDWVKHYGWQYRKLCYLKARFDPQKILAPGQGIFN